MSAPAPAPASSAAAPTQTVLIVDDEPFNINLLHSLLRDEFKVMVATNGEQALRGALSRQPDLILLDVMMQGMDGHEVCRRLKQADRTRDIPVIFITGKNEAEDEALGFDLGAVDYISKPFNSTVVRARVRTHMRLKRRGDLLESLAMLDGLTTVPNRRAFDEALQREWRRSLRNRSALSAVMIDIDCFKAFNDHYGHRGGDDCLVAVARQLVEHTRRPTDFLARYGGEEFAALLADTPHDGALQVAERWRQAVARLGIAHERSSAAGHVSLSLGVATCIASREGQVEHLLEAADQALYLAKSGGRNRVHSAHAAECAQ